MGEAGFQHVRKMLDIGEMHNLHSRDYDNQDKLQNVDKILATHFAPSSASAGIVFSVAGVGAFLVNCGGRSSDGDSPMASASTRMSSRSKPRYPLSLLLRLE